MLLRESRVFKSWNVIYPVLIYFVVTNLSMSLFTMLAVFLGADPQEQYMMLHTVVAAVTIPFIAWHYQKDKAQPTVFWEHMELEWNKKTMAVRVSNGVLMFFAGAFVGIALNNLLILSALEEVSQGYQEVNQQFFAGGLLYELLGACLLTPFLEELLYRSVVYARLCDMMILDNEEKTEKGKRREWQSRILAMALSALLFGALHMNLVQFVYAGILGFLLAWLLEKTAHFYGAFLAHMGANLMSVLRVETGLFSWMEPEKTIFYGATAAFAAMGLVCIAVIQFLWKRQPESGRV